jgi:hypothetical protein
MNDRATRSRAIFCCLWFGFVPSRVYEDAPHYAPDTYWHHARLNLKLLVRWATFRETDYDIWFEENLNTPLRLMRCE